MPSTLLQKPSNDPSQFGNRNGSDTPQAGPFLARSSNVNDLSRLSLNSQSAHRINGAPIFIRRQPEQVVGAALGLQAATSPPLSPNNNDFGQRSLQHPSTPNQGGPVQLVFNNNASGHYATQIGEKSRQERDHMAVPGQDKQRVGGRKPDQVHGFQSRPREVLYLKAASPYVKQQQRRGGKNSSTASQASKLTNQQSNIKMEGNART